MDKALTNIFWKYMALKEKFKDLNLIIQSFSKEKECYFVMKNANMYFETSLLLFKKSFEKYVDAYKKNIIDLKIINDVKELYLRRSLYNLEKSFYEEKIINNNLFGKNLIFIDIKNKTNLLINHLKNLGNDLNKIYL